MITKTDRNWRLLAAIMTLCVISALFIVIYIFGIGYRLIDVKSYAPHYPQDIPSYLIAPSYVIFREISEHVEPRGEIIDNDQFDQIHAPPPMKIEINEGYEIKIRQAITISADYTDSEIQQLRTDLMKISAGYPFLRLEFKDIVPINSIVHEKRAVDGRETFQIEYEWNFPVIERWRVAQKRLYEDINSWKWPR